MITATRLSALLLGSVSRAGMNALLGAAALGLSSPAQAIVMTATSTSASSQPATVPVTQTLQNGDFLIGANLSAGVGHVTGDGIDEPTTWAFDFSADPQYAAFIASGGVAEARLTLELNTLFFVNGVGPITDIAFPSDGAVGVFPGWQIPSFINGTFGTFTSGSITTSLVAQVGMSGSELFGWLESHGGLFPMIYADDAIVTGAALTLVSAPVPEPAPAALLLAGLGVLAGRRLRRSA
jgi:hypothetical protein